MCGNFIHSVLNFVFQQKICVLDYFVHFLLLDVLNHVINSFRTFHGGGYGVYQSTPNIPQGVASMDVDLPGAPNKKKARPLIGYKRENRHCLAIFCYYTGMN